MPHKITLTGTPCSLLRQNGETFSFDMEESGSSAVPKGLPAIHTPITYTVFLNKKQLTKAGLDKKNIQEQKLLVQGEPTLDMSVEECPGEIGVICFQIAKIEKTAKDDSSSPGQNDQQEAKEQVAAAKEPLSTVKMDKTTLIQQEDKEQAASAATEEVHSELPFSFDDQIPLASITVPEEFLQTTPNPRKTQLVIDYVQMTGQLDEPIHIQKETYVLVDGYRRYLVAAQLKMEVVPIVYR